MKNRFFVRATLVLIGMSGLFYACSKQGVPSTSSGTTSGKQAIALHLTDGPGFFDSVFIDIKTVVVVVDTCSRNAYNFFDASCAVRDTVSVTEGVYNITALTNGLDTTLAAANVHQGTIKRINITLGAGSYLVKNGVKYPLNMYPGVDSHLVIELRGDEFQTNNLDVSHLWLDFDVEHSIFVLRDGNFYLRPVIRIFAVEKTSALTGQVLPRDAYPVLSVYNGQDTMYAIPNREGYFAVRGLQTGTYSVFVNASNGYQDTTVTNVAVTAGKNTNIGVLRLHK